VSDGFELQIAYGATTAMISHHKDVRLRRTDTTIDGRPAVIEMWRPALRPRPRWPLAMRAHIDGPSDGRIDATAWCRTEADCGHAEAVFKSIVFISTRPNGIDDEPERQGGGRQAADGGCAGDCA
jgi:hypothetical protein